jgi:hypothetical protein
MEKNWVGHKELWNDIFKFLEMNDHFNLELSGKSMKTKLMTYYQQKTKNIDESKYAKNYKKKFFEKYMNSFITYVCKEEFDGFEGIEALQLNEVKENNNKKEEEKDLQAKFIPNGNTTQSRTFENSLFTQE